MRWGGRGSTERLGLRLLVIFGVGLALAALAWDEPLLLGMAVMALVARLAFGLAVALDGR